MNTKQFLEAVSKKVFDYTGSLFYTKTEIDTKIDTVEVDTSALLDKATYADTETGVVKKAKTAKALEGVTKENLDKMITIINLLNSSNPQQYIGTNIDNEFGLHYLPTDEHKDLNIEQRVALNIKTGDIINIESKADMQEQKAFIQIFKYVEGETDLINTIKEFNNTDKDNFIYNKNNIVFDTNCHIKNEYEDVSVKNEDSSFYETVFNKVDFLNINNIISEVNN
nr:MAG TPA: hypothetical protein [Caudoviricetes sp.]